MANTKKKMSQFEKGLLEGLNRAAAVCRGKVFMLESEPTVPVETAVDAVLSTEKTIAAIAKKLNIEIINRGTNRQ
jgi:hypothetical protein